MKVLLGLTSLLLLANLMVPQEIVRHNPCCYDADGRLRACPNAQPKKTATISGENCCEPKILTLRNGGPVPTVQPTFVASNLDKYSGVAPSIVAARQVVLERDSAAAEFRLDTGPPQYCRILSIHSRLNL